MPENVRRPPLATAGHPGLGPFEQNTRPDSAQQVAQQIDPALAEHAAAIRALGKCIILGRAVSNLLKRGLISPAEAELRFSELYPDNGGAP